MKIKKLLIGLLVSGLTLSFAGCGNEVINDSGEKVSSYGQFIEIKRNHYTDSGGMLRIKYLCMTKIQKLCMYILSVYIQLLQCHITYWIKMVNQK